MFRTQEEERFNAKSHLASSIFCAISFFMVSSTVCLNLLQSLTLFIMCAFSSWTFCSSFLYHNHQEFYIKFRNRFVDKVGIYFLIMASGLSFSMTTGNNAFIVVNSLTIITATCFLILRLCLSGDNSETFTLTSYILLGWFCIMPVTGIFIDTSFSQGPQLWLLLTGTMLYLVGVIFYVLDRFKWFHGAWHIASFLGFFFHSLSILFAMKIF